MDNWYYTTAASSWSVLWYHLEINKTAQAFSVNLCADVVKPPVLLTSYFSVFVFHNWVRFIPCLLYRCTAIVNQGGSKQGPGRFLSQLGHRWNWMLQLFKWSKFGTFHLTHNTLHSELVDGDSLWRGNCVIKSLLILSRLKNLSNQKWIIECCKQFVSFVFWWSLIFAITFTVNVKPIIENQSVETLKCINLS